MLKKTSINRHSLFHFVETPDDMEWTEQNELTTAPLFLLAAFNNSVVNANTDLMESIIEPLLLVSDLANNSSVNEPGDARAQMQIASAG